MPEPEWFVFQGGQRSGPFTREELVQKLAYRTPDMLVCKHGMSTWMRPADVAELGLTRPATVTGPPPAAGDEDKEQAFITAFRTLAQAYGAAVRPQGDELTFEVAHEGVLLSVLCDPGRSDATLEVLARGTYPPLRLYAEGDFERLGKRLGLNREVQTGDEEFDHRIYVDTPLPPAAVRDVAGRPGFRRGVLALIEQGFDTVEVDHEGVLVTKDVEHPGELERARLDQTLSAVAQAAAALRGIDPARSRHRRSNWPLWVSGTGVVAALVGVAALLLAFEIWPPASREPLVIGAAGAAVAGLAAMAVLTWRLRGRADALLHLAISGVALLVALPTLGASGLMALNGAFDRSPAVVRQVVVQGKSRTTSRGMRVAGPLRTRHRRYYVTVEDGPRLRRVKVPQSVHDRVSPGSLLNLSVRSGALGWEWDEKVLSS